MKKHLVLLLAFICILSFVSCSYDDNSTLNTEGIKVYDILMDEGDVGIANNLSLTNEAIPGVTFHTDEFLALYAVDDEKETFRIGGCGNSVLGLYLYDLTGDKVPELCLSMSFGSGLCDLRIVIYNYANKTIEYTLDDRAFHDYYLHLKNGILYVEEKDYGSDYINRFGLLVYKESTVTVDRFERMETNE